MNLINVEIFRYDPEKDDEGRFEKYTVELNEGARVLNLLQKIHDEIDPTLVFRYSCEAGQCGSCAIRINGVPGLACMEEAQDNMRLEPLELTVIKDLMVELVPGINKIPRINPEPDSGLLSPLDVEKIKPLRNCIECLSCVSVCPAIKVTDFIGPTAMRNYMRITLDPREQKNRINDAIESGLFTCTSCQKCWKVCPKSIQTPGKAIEKLREIANREGLTLPRHQQVAEFVKKTGRSVERDRETLLEQVPEVIEPEGEVRAEIGFFVGCMFNGRLPDRALDMLEVMKRNGVRVVIPKDQVCCGSPLIRTGQTSLLSELQEKNIKAFESRGIKTVITMCAGCGSTLKNDYETPFKVMDVSEFLSEIGIEEPAKLPITATYHDPCHLLRGQGISEQPRELLNMVVDKFVEMPNECCGAGGGVRSGLPDEAASLGKMRGEEIIKSGADVVVSICPFCEFHIQENTDKPVKNLLSLLLEGYRKKDKENIK